MPADRREAVWTMLAFRTFWSVRASTTALRTRFGSMVSLFSGLLWMSGLWIFWAGVRPAGSAMCSTSMRFRFSERKVALARDLSAQRSVSKSRTLQVGATVYRFKLRCASLARCCEGSQARFTCGSFLTTLGSTYSPGSQASH